MPIWHLLRLLNRFARRRTRCGSASPARIRIEGWASRFSNMLRCWSSFCRSGRQERRGSFRGIYKIHYLLGASIGSILQNVSLIFACLVWPRSSMASILEDTFSKRDIFAHPHSCLAWTISRIEMSISRMTRSRIKIKITEYMSRETKFRRRTLRHTWRITKMKILKVWFCRRWRGSYKIHSRPTGKKWKRIT